MWQIWLIAAIIFAIVEIFTPGFFFLSFTAGCLAAMIASFFPLGIIWQCLIALLALALFVVFLRPMILKITNKKGATNTERLIGMEGVVEMAIKNSDKGRVKVDGTTWPAVSKTDIAEGKKVRIMGVEGITLHVKEV